MRFQVENLGRGFGPKAYSKKESVESKRKFPPAIKKAITLSALVIGSYMGYDKFYGQDYSELPTFNEAFGKAKADNKRVFRYRGKRFNTEFKYHELQNEHSNNSNDVFSDYSQLEDFNKAFKKARDEKRQTFIWSGKSFTTDLVGEEVSKNYFESKKFLEDYYASEYFKAKYKNFITKTNDAVTKLTRNLKEPIYFSITNQRKKGSNDVGFYIPGPNRKIFISTKNSEEETVPVHELSHKATESDRFFNNSGRYFPMSEAALASMNRHPEFLIKHSERGIEYWSQPTEIDARQNSARFWLFKHFPGYTAGSLFTDEHYLFLQKNYEKLPFDIKQLLDLFPDDKVFISNMNKW